MVAHRLFIAPTAVACLLAALVGAGSGCLVTVRTDVEPPAAKVEVEIDRPGPDYAWIGGYWAWRGATWVWIGGHWERERVGHQWVPGHWDKRGRRWVWVAGHWRRR